MARRSSNKKRSRQGRPTRPSGQRTILIASIAIIALGLVLVLPQLIARGRLPEVGKPIADFTATDVDGRPFTLSEAYRDNELILVFYRGHG